MTKQQQAIDSQQPGYGRLPFFPVPKPGETVFSLFTRAVARTGLPAKYIIEALTGQSLKTPLLAALPGHLKRISESVPYGHPWADINSIITGHTLFTYFSYFDTGEQRAAAFQAMAETKSCIKTILSLGIASYRQEVKSAHPRFCIDCLKEDQQNGFTYFHREHQLPAVALCWKHESKLTAGCQKCNPFTGHAHGVLMVGRCQCSDGITPADSFYTLPADHSLLKWFADQSAYMVNSDGVVCDNVRSALRQAFLLKGFGRGSLLDYAKIAGEIERKYGTEFLNWIGYPAWENNAVSPWVRRFLHERLVNRRSPAIIYLLLIGVLYESLQDFEQSILSGGDNGLSEGEECSPLRSEPIDEKISLLDSGKCTFENNLINLLEEHRYRISAVAARVGVSPNAIAIEAKKQGIRVPLSARTLSIHGKDKIDEVCSCLRSGMPKNEIQNRYKVSEWTIILIELDDPEINNAHRLATAENLMESHRRKVLEFVANNVNASKTDLMKFQIGTYEFMLDKDKQWFDLQFANQTKKVKPKLVRKFKQRPDSQVTSEVTKIIANMLSPNEKPRRITISGVLKKTGYFSQFQSRKELFPQTVKVLNQFEESQAEFLKRKIKWAMSEMCKSGQAISINRLRRVAGVPASILRERREFVINTAKDIGAVINGRSFFIDT